MTTAQAPYDDKAVDDAIADCGDQPGALLPVLHAVQDRLGHIPPEAVKRIASALNLSRAEVHGVVSFYHHFREHPCGRHVVEICRAEACQARGARHLDEYARSRLGCGFHETSADGVSLEPVYCLGLCATGPAIAIDGTPYSRVTAARFDALLERSR